jgi:hypothetical protein
MRLPAPIPTRQVQAGDTIECPSTKRPERVTRVFGTRGGWTRIRTDHHDHCRRPDTLITLIWRA